MNTNLFPILVFITFFMLSCNSEEEKEENLSNSSVKKDPNDYTSGKSENKGNASFSIDGELEGEYSGIAYFRPFERNGLHSWGLTLIDQQPMTFTVSFAQTSDQPISAPEVGTYTLGVNPGNQSDDIYLTSFEYFETEPFNKVSYSVGIGKTSGTLEITTSTNELLEGTFSFTATRLEKGKVAGTIEVSQGKFRAVPTR